MLGGSFEPQSRKFNKTHPARLARYNWVAEYVKDKSILDLGCGHGFGTFLLADTAKMAVGIDIDIKAVNYAKHNYKKENLLFSIGNVGDVNVLYDMIVCLEVIEHVEDPDSLLKMIGNNLKPDGFLFLSTPNRLFTEVMYSNRQSQNQYHVREFSPNEIQLMLRKYFSKIESFVLDWPQRKDARYMSEFITKNKYPGILKQIIPNSLKSVFLKRHGFDFIPPENIIYQVRREDDINQSYPVQMYKCQL